MHRLTSVHAETEPGLSYMRDDDIESESDSRMPKAEMESGEES